MALTASKSDLFPFETMWEVDMHIHHLRGHDQTYPENLVTISKIQAKSIIQSYAVKAAQAETRRLAQ